MTTMLFSSELLRRLRRSVLLSGVLFLSLTAAICGDDDDDDDGTGPSAACLDEFEDLLAEVDFDEDDVESIDVGDSDSGSLSENDVQDPESDRFVDAYILELDDDNELQISLNPSGFDAVLLLWFEGQEDPTVADSEDPNATETLEGEADAGCYLIGVTSFEAEETGSYTLSVDEI